MKFFLPGFSEEEMEGAYAAIAALCGVDVPPLGKRVHSIRIRHDGIDYVATVGQAREATDWRRKRGGRVDERPSLRRHPRQHRDDARDEDAAVPASLLRAGAGVEEQSEGSIDFQRRATSNP